MAELTLKASPPRRTFGTKAGKLFCKSPSGEDAGTISPLSPHQNSKMLYIVYKDHAVFKNAELSAAGLVLREAVGWAKKENDEILLLECDRPVDLKASGFNGVAILKCCIVSIVELPVKSFSKWSLNRQAPNEKLSMRSLPKERKTQPNNTEGRKKHD